MPTQEQPKSSAQLAAPKPDVGAPGKPTVADDEKLTRIVARIMDWHAKAAIALCDGTLFSGRFKLLSELGQGGFGVVYRAIDESSGTVAHSVEPHGEPKPIALKLIRFQPDSETAGVKPISPQKRESVVRLINEIRRQSETTPIPGCVPLLNCCPLGKTDLDSIAAFLEDHPLWFYMPVYKCSLAAHLQNRGGKLPVDEAVDIMARVADTLDSLHRHGKDGMLHRDLKPGNILLTEDDKPVISDYGLSVGGFDQRVTGNTISGTWAYMSPEQIDGRATTAKSDIWSWGVILYQLISGKLPFGGADLVARIRSSTFESLDVIARTCPRYLVEIVDRCLRKDAKQFTSFQEVLATLDDGLRDGFERMKTKLDGVQETVATGREEHAAALDRLIKSGTAIGAKVEELGSTIERMAATTGKSQRELITSDELLSLARAVSANLLSEAYPGSRCHVPFQQVEEHLQEFLDGESTSVIIDGLPGAGKTTLLKLTAHTHNGFYIRLNDLTEGEDWWKRGEFAISRSNTGCDINFPKLVKLLAAHRDKVVVCLDGLERTRDATLFARRISEDRPSFPPNVKFVLGIRRSALSDQVEERLAELKAGVIQIPILRGPELDRFLIAFHLPRELPHSMRRSLTTPFLVSAVANTTGSAEVLSKTASEAIHAAFEAAIAANSAKQVFLHAFSRALLIRDSYSPVPAAEVIDCSGNKLAATDCDVDTHDSLCRQYYDRGLITDNGKGLAATHDRLAEYLVARELIRERNRDGPEAAARRLLAALPDGPLWSCTDFLLEMFNNTEERYEYLLALLEPASTYFATLTEEDRLRMSDEAVTALHYGLSGIEQMRRFQDEEQDHWMARRSAHILASMYVASPSIMTPFVVDCKDRDLTWWVWSAVLLRVIHDPYFFALVDPSDEHTVRTVTNAMYSLARKSLGVEAPIILEGGGLQDMEDFERERENRLGQEFPGPQLPLLYDVQRLPTGLELIYPPVLTAVERALPALLSLAGQCRHEIPRLDGLVDYVGRFRNCAETPVPWNQLLRDVRPDSLVALGVELSSAYPYVELAMLLAASRDAFNQGVPFESVKQFNMVVISRMQEFVKLQLSKPARPAHHLWAIDQGCATIRMGVELGGAFVSFQILGEAIRKLESIVVRIAGLELCERSMAIAFDKWQTEKDSQVPELSKKITDFFMAQGRTVLEQLTDEVASLGVSVPDDASVLPSLAESTLGDEDRTLLVEVRKIFRV